MKGYFVQYKFILPKTVKHSSYTYQKLFRAIYGYSQQVSKSSGKTYVYHRPGILSKTPFIKHGKNCVVIPQEKFSELISFFKTGKNPSHSWTIKGDWKAVYYLNEKEVDETAVISSLEHLLDRTHIINPLKEHGLLLSEMETIKKRQMEKKTSDVVFSQTALTASDKIVNTSWFKEVYNKSDKLKYFYSLYTFLKSQ
ncbi:MAG: hypothetical protein COT90_01150 [Candidatus Diapherotrites archaeon CG10_big_fil_rev_8_21_14_0_10_31_34]|nr:MAG: hypothetical protein COT90_01150 [Candidatus Diapherotrites archaeon CG10_big_fil_rev_8_21_14_0_10_31_34]